MVGITVFFEGGVDPQTNRDPSAVSRTIRLRRAMSTLLNAYFDGQAVKIDARPMGSYTNVIKIREKDAFLLIDLERHPSERNARMQELQLTDIPDQVFFMVQAMEAWILSQPQAIEKTFAHLKTTATSISDEAALQIAHPEEIYRPAFELKVILGRHFEDNKAGKKTKLKYGKLVEGSQLLEALDIHALSKTFPDVQLLLERVSKKAI